MPTVAIDHIAMPTADAERLIAFYRRLNFDVNDEAWRSGKVPVFWLHVGEQRINVHPEGFTTDLRGLTATPGCADICFVFAGSVEECREMIADAGVAILSGPVRLTGGRGRGTIPSTSLYARDPDGNLLEWMIYDEPPNAV